MSNNSLRFLQIFISDNTGEEFLEAEELKEIALHLRISKPLFFDKQNEDLFTSLSYRFNDTVKGQNKVEGFQEVDNLLNEINQDLKISRLRRVC